MRTLCLLIGLVLVAGGCSDTSGPATLEHLGTYTLTSVNDSPLPYTVYEDPDARVEVLGGVILLEENELFQIEMITRLHFLGEVDTDTGTSMGTYQLVNDELTFVYADGSGFPASLVGNSLRVDVPASPGAPAATFLFVR
jgi:hypothetical protein